ncbi:hypothetical protein AB205_0081340 [Aquarana catesbeiana]|uniref:Uncharacterized protein n=1 Tax=Aquarana catesbeiana TaxID=8400 RepID=A0A2G9RWP3_AQUCT|nr:hypothetical protein AB205_0081340 [Aquarana catesbeiana]
MPRTHGRTFHLQKSDGRRRTKSGGKSDRVWSPSDFRRTVSVGFLRKSDSSREPGLRRACKDSLHDKLEICLKGLDTSFPQMSTGTKQSIYNTFIRPYLTTKDTSNAIVCYNQTNANSSAWLVTNMASFLSSTSDVDLMHFANDTMLQIFANDASCVALASKLTFSQSTSVYYTSLLTSNANFNLSSLPPVFLCFLNPSALKNLTVDDSLALTKKLNKQCFPTSPGQAASKPTTEQLQTDRQ